MDGIEHYFEIIRIRLSGGFPEFLESGLELHHCDGSARYCRSYQRELQGYGMCVILNSAPRTGCVYLGGYGSAWW